MRLAIEDAVTLRRIPDPISFLRVTRRIERGRIVVDERCPIVLCSPLPNRPKETPMKSPQERHQGRRRLHSRALLGSLVLVSLGLGACGDDQGDESAELQSILRDGDLTNIMRSMLLSPPPPMTGTGGSRGGPAGTAGTTGAAGRGGAGTTR